MQFFSCPWEPLWKNVKLLLYLVPKRRGLITLEQGEKKSHTIFMLPRQYLFCFARGKAGCINRLQKHALQGFGKKTCSRKCASVNKPLCFVITPPILQPFKTRHRLWVHLAQPDNFSSWLSKRGEKLKKTPKIHSAIGLSAQPCCSHHSWQSYTAAFIFLLVAINFLLKAGIGHCSPCLPSGPNPLKF